MTFPASEGGEAARIRARLAGLAEERAALETRLAALEDPASAAPEGDPTGSPVTDRSSSEAKIALFRLLFAGREDVFPRRWENARTGKAGYAPACANEWKPGLCGKPRVRCGVCPNRAFLPVSDEEIAAHLRGRHTIGVYPLLPDGTCRFVAADFDKASWHRDADAFLDACRSAGVPAALERSRSGNGGHVWIFFADPVPAALARRLGSHLLTEAMARHPDIGFGSYDRFFPSQDIVPEGGFGNLIALPLQGGPRRGGNSVFLDADFEPHADQWAYLSSLRRLPLAEAEAIVEEAGRRGRIVGLRLPLEDSEDEEPWTAPPSRSRTLPPIAGPLPSRIGVVLGDRLYVPRSGLPPALVDRLVRLAAFQNPAFHSAQAMRRSTWGIPRIVTCGELLPHHVALPRGCRAAMEELLDEHGIGLDLRDERNPGRPVETAFQGELSAGQKSAAAALLAHETGVLATATGFGKTVVAASVIAARGTNTLVLVHRRQLMDQWIARLGAFLDLPASAIGLIGGDARRPGGIVDVGVIQSLVRNGEVDDMVADYGHLVVDECHHLPAVSFEAVAARDRGAARSRSRRRGTGAGRRRALCRGGVRRRPPGHAVPSDAGLVERHARAVCRPAAPAASGEARGGRPRLCRQCGAGARADGRAPHPGLSRSRLRGGRGRRDRLLRPMRPTRCGVYSPRFAAAAMRRTWVRGMPNWRAIAAGPTPAASAARTIFFCPGVSGRDSVRFRALAPGGAPVTYRRGPLRSARAVFQPRRSASTFAARRSASSWSSWRWRSEPARSPGRARRGRSPKPCAGSPAPRCRPVPVMSACAPAGGR